MDRETAYCYLNCGHSKNCCGECGECPECCKNCNISNDGSFAYFRDNQFYSNYILTEKIISHRDYCTNYVCRAGTISSFLQYNSKIKKCSGSGIIKIQGYSDEGDAFFSDVTWNGGETKSLTCYESDPCARSKVPNQSPAGWDVVCDKCPKEITYSTPCPSCGKVDNCGNKACFDPYDCGYCGDDGCYGGTTNGNPIGIEKINISISFYDPVKLYDRYGNDVGNIIGAYFNECDACKLWMAPSCHFFAP